MMRQAGRHMQAYRDLCEEYPTFRDRSETPAVATEISLQPWRAYRVDGLILFSDILTPLPAMGVNFDVSEHGKITIAPVRTRDDLDRICNHPFAPKEDLPFVAGALRGIACPFTLCTYLLEGRTGTIDNFAATREMMETDPELVRDLLELLVDRLADYATYQVQQGGAQVVQLFDSWAGWLERSDFEQWAFLYQKELVERLKQRVPTVPLILYMAPLEKSRSGAFLDLMAATGVDVVSIDHTVGVEEARARLDEAGYPTTVIQGNMHPSVLAEGPVESIQRKTTDIMSKCSSDADKGRPALAFRGHIMNLGHGIDKDTPEPHAAAFVKAVQTYTVQ
jgi:uroporphyrinogen decarboxylase